MDWIRIRMDPELLPGSGTRKIQSWIQNKSFRIHNSDNTLKKLIFVGSGSVSFDSGSSQILIRIQPNFDPDPGSYTDSTDPDSQHL